MMKTRAERVPRLLEQIRSALLDVQITHAYELLKQLQEEWESVAAAIGEINETLESVSSRLESLQDGEW